MSCKLYANIGIGHENDFSVLEKRVVSAAQCNADAVVLNKSTPSLVVPENKKYVSINSKWGSLPYIEVANKSELSKENAVNISNLCNQIGIPIIWSVTDSRAGEFVKEHCNAEQIKIHFDHIDSYELTRFCATNFKYVIYPHTVLEDISAIHGKKFKEFAVYYTTEKFPPQIDELKLHNIDNLIKKNFTTGYEGREAGIFPCMALSYKGLHFIEKYLGDDVTDNTSILTPAQLYDLWNSLKLMSDADQ